MNKKEFRQTEKMAALKLEEAEAAEIFDNINQVISKAACLRPFAASEMEPLWRLSNENTACIRQAQEDAQLNKEEVLKNAAQSSPPFFFFPATAKAGK